MSSSIKSYFERKKRDLSDKSTYAEETKKTRTSSLDLSLSKKKKQVMTLMYLSKE